MLSGYIVSVWDGEKVLEMDDVDGCTAMWIYIMPLNGTLKYGKFYVINIFTKVNLKNITLVEDNPFLYFFLLNIKN